MEAVFTKIKGWRVLIKVCWEAKATGLEKCICGCKPHRAGARAGTEITSYSKQDKSWPCHHPLHTMTRVSTSKLHTTTIPKKL